MTDSVSVIEAPARDAPTHESVLQDWLDANPDAEIVSTESQRRGKERTLYVIWYNEP